MVERQEQSQRKQERIIGYSEASWRVFAKAQKLAPSNSNIGVGHIFEALMSKINVPEVINILDHNRINSSRLIENLAYVQFDSEVIQAGQEVGLTSKAKGVLRSSVIEAKDRKASWIEPSDLLIGIAKYAERTRRRIDTKNEKRISEVEPFKIRKPIYPRK